MMGLSAWIDLITAALKFPSEIMSIVNMLKETPAEQHADVVKAMLSEAENFKKTGRPTWG